jgi:pSer/pThr/pTyr-binding forkhead associated (FHA) protein
VMVELTTAMRASLGKLWLRAVPPAKLLDSDGKPFEKFEVPEAGAVIGRGEDADVTVKDPDEYVSRTHLLLRASGVRWTAVDLGSSHGTQLLTAAGNSIQLSPGIPIPLADRDRLTLARVASVDVTIAIARRKGRPTRRRAEERLEREFLRPPLDQLAFELLRPRRESPGSVVVPSAAILAARLNVSERTVYEYRKQLAAARPLAGRLDREKLHWDELADAVAAVYPYLAAPIREMPVD